MSDKCVKSNFADKIEVEHQNREKKIYLQLFSSFLGVLIFIFTSYVLYFYTVCSAINLPVCFFLDIKNNFILKSEEFWKEFKKQIEKAWETKLSTFI